MSLKGFLEDFLRLIVSGLIGTPRTMVILGSLGSINTAVSIFPVMVRVWVVLLALVLIWAVLRMVPENFLVSTFRVILPVAPGAMTWPSPPTVVQPQEGLIFSIRRGDPPLFLTTKSWITTSPCSTEPQSKTSSATSDPGGAKFFGGGFRR